MIATNSFDHTLLTLSIIIRCFHKNKSKKMHTCVSAYHVRVCMNTHMHLHTTTRICMYAHACTRLHLSTYICTQYARTRMYASAFVCIHLHTSAYNYTHPHAYIIFVYECENVLSITRTRLASFLKCK